MRRVLLGLLLVAAAHDARSQMVPDEAELAWTNVPLAEALYELAEATGLELVFALRLVEDVRIYGRYRVTDDPDRALRLLLRGTGVRAERIRAGQYVLIKEPPNVTAESTRDAFTGTLDGRVVDAESSVALLGAHIWLVDLGLGAVAGTEGGFAVPDLPTGRYVVRVSHVGYQPVRLELDVFPDSPRLPPTIRLQEVTVESDNASVVAGPPAPGPTPGMTDLSARQAAAVPTALGEADLAATLSWLPGLSRTGGASGAIVVRGADPQQTRYIRDGVPLYEPWHGFGLFSAFQPEGLGRVRFHRGSLPAPLGGGLAAVLDVETTDALAGDSVRAIGLGAVVGRLVADVPLSERVGVHLGAQRSTLGALLAPTIRAEGGAWVLDPAGGTPFQAREPSVAFGDASAKVSIALGVSRQLDLSGTLGGDDIRVELPGGEAAGMDYRWRTHTTSARLRSLIGSRTFITALAYQTGHDAAERRIRPLAVVETDQAIAENGISVDVDHFRSLSHQIRGGVQIAERTVTGAQRLGPMPDARRQQVTEVAGYVQDTWRPGGGWELQPGLRAEVRLTPESASRVDWSPRLFARWTPEGESVVVRAGVSRQTQAVHRVRGRASGRYDLASSRWLLADDQVPLARAWQAGAGAEWAPSQALALSADAYVRLSSGLLEPSSIGGIEASVRPGALLRTHPPHDGRAVGLELAARYLWGGWTLGMTGAVASAVVRPESGGAWRPSAYDRPVSLGLLAQRRRGPWTAALRLDAESGLPRPQGGRDAVQLRASGAVGVTSRRWGLDWTANAQATLQPYIDADPVLNPDLSLPLAADTRGLPLWPVLSLTARW
ncbi:MAG: TonB-dependent receptor [Bacteroidota bacterium]